MKTADRSHVHALVDQLAPTQLAAVETLLQSMLSPSLDQKLAAAQVDDEPFTEEDRQAVAEADQSVEHTGLITLEDVLADFGLTADDWETMARTPIRMPLSIERK